MTDFSGVWQSYYRYPSKGRGDGYWDHHKLFATQNGDILKLETGADNPSHVVMELELDAAGEMANGVWREQTDPHGAFKGEEYEGTIQLRIAASGDRLNGVWHGASRDSKGTLHSDVWELNKVKPANKASTLPKKWTLTHWYPSSDDSEEKSETHEMKSYWHDDTLILESLPKDDGSYMLVRLHIQDGVATGNWYENASLTGEAKGAQYSGAGQLVVDPKTHHMVGIWAGAGYNYNEKKMQIYSGRWEVKPAD